MSDGKVAPPPAPAKEGGPVVAEAHEVDTYREYCFSQMNPGIAGWKEESGIIHRTCTNWPFLV
jgi:hypothetical protein